jgi:hypothetical protein
MLGAAYCADAGMEGCMLVCGRCLLMYVEGWWVWHGGWEVHVGVFSGKVGGRHMWCMWRDGGWELLVGVFGGKVGVRCMWCIWRNGGGNSMWVYLVGRCRGGRHMWCIWRNGAGNSMWMSLVGRWVGGACGVSGGMVVGSECRCVWWEGGWEANVGVYVSSRVSADQYLQY